jgi:hypothetical protein
MSEYASWSADTRGRTPGSSLAFCFVKSALPRSSPYLEHLSSRFACFLSPVALPLDHLIE